MNRVSAGIGAAIAHACQALVLHEPGKEVEHRGAGMRGQARGLREGRMCSSRAHSTASKAVMALARLPGRVGGETPDGVGVAPGARRARAGLHADPLTGGAEALRPRESAVLTPAIGCDQVSVPIELQQPAAWAAGGIAHQSAAPAGAERWIPGLESARRSAARPRDRGRGSRDGPAPAPSAPRGPGP